MFQSVVCRGKEAAPYFFSIARLRIDIFREFPYLYDGSLDYEREYLAAYFSVPESCVVLVWDGAELVACSTSLPLKNAFREVLQACERVGFSVGDVSYFGESLIKPAYRKQGLARSFFEIRERIARELGHKQSLFMAVDRGGELNVSDGFGPSKGYQSPEGMWQHFGYCRVKGGQVKMAWPRVDLKKNVENTLSMWSKVLI